MDEKGFSFIRTAQSGKLLKIIYDPRTHYIHIDYCNSLRKSNWRQLTTCAEYIKHWLGYEIRETRSGKSKLGNSVLIKIRPSIFMYIGQEVFTFTHEEGIQDFASEEGGGRIPFSVAFGSKSMFFLTEHVVISYEDMGAYLRKIKALPRVEEGEDNKEESLAGVLRSIDPTQLYRNMYRMRDTDEYEAHGLKIISRML